MIRFLFRVLRRLLSLALGITVLLLLPVGYVELACRGQDPAAIQWEPAAALAPAYAEVAQGYAGGNPQETRFAGIAWQHWSGLCSAAPTAPEAALARVPAYGDAAYLTADMVVRGVYEETLGRGYAIWRGDDPAPLDAVVAAQMAGFAASLQTAPWYAWGFRGQAAELTAARTEAQRDYERWIGLGAGSWARAGLGWVTARIAPLVAPSGAG
ncbi:hypothetical protein [Mesobacterium pallidum]|uniref:hypothetical protein n=1 Tax=Mesobacterium pallidum TaxID=2872037 RepID=UPI001EE18768|nr:hypothetical protein [Mesobacterium pallidum]